MNCATSSASAPATINMFPPIAADCSTSGGPRPCWLFCKPHDPGLASSQLRRYLLAQALTEPPDEERKAEEQKRRKQDRLNHHWAMILLAA